MTERKRKFSKYLNDDSTGNYVTRNGCDVKVCVVDNSYLYGYYKKVDIWLSMIWYIDGSARSSMSYDLFDIPMKHTRWVNFYESDNSYVAYSTRSLADLNAAPDRTACMKVEYEEGEGLNENSV